MCMPRQGVTKGVKKRGQGIIFLFYITSIHSIEKCVELFVKEKKEKF